MVRITFILYIYTFTSKWLKADIRGYVKFAYFTRCKL